MMSTAVSCRVHVIKDEALSYNDAGAQACAEFAPTLTNTAFVPIITYK